MTNSVCCELRGVGCSEILIISRLPTKISLPIKCQQNGIFANLTLISNQRGRDPYIRHTLHTMFLYDHERAIYRTYEYIFLFMSGYNWSVGDGNRTSLTTTFIEHRTMCCSVCCVWEQHFPLIQRLSPTSDITEMTNACSSTISCPIFTCSRKYHFLMEWMSERPTD